MVLNGYGIKRVLNSAYIRAGSALKPKSKRFKHVVVNGLDIVVPLHEAIGWCLYWQKKYEEDLIFLIQSQVKPGSFCIDIGANLGFVSCCMASHAGHDGKVLAFEPDPTVASLARFNLALNGYHENSVVSQLAVSDADGTAEFYRSRDSGYSGLRDTHRRAVDLIMSVPTRRLDSLFAEEKRRIDFVKIDVEGAELQVLKGFSDILSDADRRPSTIVFENYPINQIVFGYGPKEIISFIKSFGYKVESLSPCEDVQAALNLVCSIDRNS